MFAFGGEVVQWEGCVLLLWPGAAGNDASHQSFFMEAVHVY